MKRLQPKNDAVRILIVVMGIAVAVAGCGKQEPQPAPPPPAAPKPAAPPKPVQAPVSSALKLAPPPANQFDFSSKKDPFKPFAVVKVEPKPSEMRRQKPLKDAIPIHSFDVGQFRLIGIITGDKENRAMVVDPNGKGYVIKVGMTIGKNEGRVTTITAGGMDVLEQFRDDNGKVRKEKIRLALPRKQ